MLIRVYPSNLTTQQKQGCHLDYIESILAKVGINISAVEGSIKYVTHDRHVLEAYADGTGYPNGIAAKLVDKAGLQQVMAEFGFATLPSEIIFDVESILLKNFIVKHRYSSGKLGVTKTGACLHNPFNGIPFADKEALKNHPLFKSPLFIDGDFIAQQDAGIRKHTLATVAAVANSNSDLLFLRNTTDEWEFLDRKSTTLAFNVYPELNAKIQEFFKLHGIKNASVTVQFVIKDNEYYPVDWNFRFGTNMGKEMRARNPIEFETGILHMVGNTTTPQFTYTDTWVTEFK
jgi:hypothetical protein